MYICSKCKKEYTHEGFCTSDGMRLISKEATSALRSTNTSITNYGVLTVIFNIVILLCCIAICWQINGYHYVFNEMQYLNWLHSLLIISALIIKFTSECFYGITCTAMVLTQAYMLYPILFINTSRGFYALNDSVYFYYLIAVPGVTFIILMILLITAIKANKKRKRRS